METDLHTEVMRQRWEPRPALSVVSSRLLKGALEKATPCAGLELQSGHQGQEPGSRQPSGGCWKLCAVRARRRRERPFFPWSRVEGEGRAAVGEGGWELLQL